MQTTHPLSPIPYETQVKWSVNESDGDPIGGIGACGLALPDDLDDLSPPEAHKPGDGVTEEYLGELGLLDLTT